MKSIKKYAAVLIVIAAAIGMMGCKAHVDPKNHEHTENSGIITKAPTCMNKGVRTFMCSICGGNERTETIDALGWCETAIDTETYNEATSSSTYIYFGVFPKTVKASTVNINKSESVTMGANTYYKGSDGEWYAKVTANPFEKSTSNPYKYTDGTAITVGNTDFFMVEPVKWKVITSDYNNTKNALLLAEEILTGNIPYHTDTAIRTIGDKTICSNNYKYSFIRAYLNGKYESDDTQDKTTYTNKGFLQTAFTTSAQNLIADTVVDNSADSTTDEDNTLAKSTMFACDNTTDKIFLLSEKEATTKAYGFPETTFSESSSNRIRYPTDYAMANYAADSRKVAKQYGGLWWIRSPVADDGSFAYSISFMGSANFRWISDQMNLGIVPALTISLSKTE